MRLRTDRNTCALLPIAAVLSLSGLNGCDKLTPSASGASETITLLREGSERVCVAPAVQDALRGLIIPKPTEVDGEAAADEARSAIAAVSVTFDLTTLESTDKSVSRATCNTVIKVTGLNGDPRQFRVAYQVSPSAENPNAFVVSGDTDDVRVFIRSEVGDVISHQSAAKAQEQEAAQADHARQQLLATVTPKWLVGVWIASDADATLCSNGQGFAFHANHTITGTELYGRWVLTQNQLHAVGQGMSGAAELDGTVTAADPLSFTVTSKEGTSRSFRRCTREEVTAGTTGLPSTAPVQSVPPPQN